MLVVGAGMVGASVALAATGAGYVVSLIDADPRAVDLAETIGAGQQADGSTNPDLIVVAVPPRAVPEIVVDQLRLHPKAVVTDVASVKGPILRSLDDLLEPAERARFVPGHPMAGSERSGPLAARRDLFVGRAWAVLSDAGTEASARELVVAFAQACGARVVHLSGRDHDAAVALVSHLPHITAATLAGLLAQAPAEHLELAGQGVRDVTRIAAGDPRLWRQILSSNAGELARMARLAADGLSAFADQLDDAASTGASEALTGMLNLGVAGVSRLPGKHGRREDFVTVDVVIPDRPGALAALFADVTSAGVNIEDIRIDHNPANEQGHAQLAVLPEAEESLARALTEHGWSVAG